MMAPRRTPDTMDQHTPEEDLRTLRAAYRTRVRPFGAERLRMADRVGEAERDHPEYRERVTFIAHLIPSRQDVPEYVEYLERIEALVAVVNHRHGTTVVDVGETRHQPAKKDSRRPATERPGTALFSARDPYGCCRIAE
jgi:hypothetical protein